MTLTGLGWSLRNAWQETVRHEAYLPQLEAMARQSPYDGRLLGLLAARQMEAGDYAVAADTLRRAIAVGEQNEDVWLNLAAAVAADGDTRKAVTDLQIGIHSLSVAPRLLAAEGSVGAQGRNLPPLQLMTAISPEGSRSLAARYGQGSFLNGISEWWGRYHAADSGFGTRQAWAIQQPENAEAQRLWGEALFRNQRYPEAEAALQKALAESPQSPATHLALAELEAATGRPAKASLEYLRCLQLHPDLLRALLGLGQVSIAIGQGNLALRAYTQSTRVAPRSTDAWVGLGQAYVQNGGTNDQAVAAFQTAARLAPQRIDFLDDYANALRLASHWTEAEVIIRRSLASAPDDAYAHYLFGRLLHDNAPTAERAAEAETETRTSVRLTPHAPLANRQLGEILLDRGDTAEAITVLTNALRFDPYDHSAMLLLARAFGRAHQPALAAQVSHQADVLYRDQQRVLILAGEETAHFTDVNLHQELADLYARTGESQKAQREADLVKLLKSDPAAAVRTKQSLDASLREAFHEK